jgi:hypothetical protein
MPDEPSQEPAAEPDEDDWAAEIKRLRASRGQRLAEQLADEGRAEPPVE